MSWWKPLIAALTEAAAGWFGKTLAEPEPKPKRAPRKKVAKAVE